MILVTGGAGFVGSNLIKRLNLEGRSDIIVVDNLKKADKYKNLVDLDFNDYLPKDDFLTILPTLKNNIEAIFHQGACTDTLEYDGDYMLRNNFDYSKALLHFSVERNIPFIYASSAAVYGHSRVATENTSSEAPLNIYGYSKLLFDRYVRAHIDVIKNAVVGLRYFNVYGNRESHKGRMSSMVFQFREQLIQTGVAKVFGAAGGCAAGEQTRDFVYVKDLVDLNLYFWQRDPVQAVVNAGTGQERTWNDLAKSIISELGRGAIEYVEFPPSLLFKYQFHTRSNPEYLRRLGYDKQFTTLEEGVTDYFKELAVSEAQFLPVTEP